MRKFLFCVILHLSTVAVYCQIKDFVPFAKIKEYCLQVGLGYGKSPVIDCGFSLYNYTVSKRHRYFWAPFSISTEVQLDKDRLIAFKTGSWAGGGATHLAIGMDWIYYTDFTEGSIVFRPQAGFVFRHIKLTYGYNARVTNTSFDKVARNVVNASLFIKLKEIDKSSRKNGS
jgi:hypothetical protein